MKNLTNSNIVKEIIENVKDDIKEGFILQAMINVKLQDVFVVKTDNVEKVKKALLVAIK